MTFPNTFTPTNKVFAVEGLLWSNTNVTSKTVLSNFILFDAASTESRANVNLGLIAWRTSHHTFEKTPAGNEWDDMANTYMDSIQVIIGSPDSNGASDHHSGMRLVIYEARTWAQPVVGTAGRNLIIT